MKHIGTQTIETDRLLLRKYEMTDVDDMFRNWVTDPEASRFWGCMHYLETKYKEISDCPHISGDYCFYEITLEDWIFTNVKY